MRKLKNELNFSGRRKAFTLAETMIVLIVLGIIATLTIPALVNKNKESVAKTKLRKAMATYESALNKMIIENDLKDNGPLTTWAGNSGDGCANSTQYFKKSKDINGCIFKTTDGVWWNISDIERPVISFKEINTNNAEEITTKANNADDKTAFVLVGRFGNDGSLRVDDLAYETSNSIADAYGNQSKAQVEKLYSLLGMKKASGGGGNTSPFAACNHADTCTITYNCPTTEEPNKTCTMEYTKVTFEEDYSEDYEYCVPEDWIGDPDWICGEDDDKWKQGESKSKAGEYYIAIEGYPDDHDTQAYDYDGSTCQECIDNGWGDYYNAAERHCESSGGRLATIAEFRSLYSQGKLPSDRCFWASEYVDSVTAYYLCDGGTLYNDDIKANYYNQVLCLGQ